MDHKDLSQKIKQPFCVDWVDSVHRIINDKGDLEEAGTVLAVCNNLIFLKPLSKNQLTELARVVQDAVNYELSKRKS